MARRKTSRQSAVAKGLEWLPPQKKRSVGGVLATVLIGIPMLAFGNLILGSAVVSTAIGQWQQLTDTTVHGVLSETGTRTVRSRRGPDEHYCLAYFDSDDGRYVHHRVRVYVDAEDCDVIEGSAARLVPGAANALSEAITSDSDNDLSDPMAFDGLYGMTDGASIGRSGDFLKGLWPYLFIAPITLGADVVLIDSILKRGKRAVRRSRKHAQQTSPGHREPAGAESVEATDPTGEDPT